MNLLLTIYIVFLGYVGRIYENPPDQIDETTSRVFQTEIAVILLSYLIN